MKMYPPYLNLHTYFHDFSTICTLYTLFNKQSLWRIFHDTNFHIKIEKAFLISCAYLFSVQHIIGYFDEI